MLRVPSFRRVPLTEMIFVGLLVPFFASCAASKNPLSDPGEAKPDPRLVGTWLLKVWGGQYDVRCAGGKLPEAVLIGVSSGDVNKNDLPLLGFPTVIGENTYLNLTLVKRDDQLRALREKGWKPNVLQDFLILKS